jgi:polar amino acid transport system substrate-binding protein
MTYGYYDTGVIPKMKKRSRTLLVPIVCLVAAIALLYAKPYISGRIQHPFTVPVLKGDGPEQIITIHYHERPPYYVTGPLGVYGLCVDPVKKAFLAADIPVKWVKTPAVRQLDILQYDGKNNCIIGWFKNPAREKYAVYSHYIYQDKPTIALARADNHRMVSGRPLEETVKNPDLVLLQKQGYSYGQFVDDMIAAYHPKQQIITAENIGMLKSIHAGLADYFFIAEEEARELIRTSGLPADDFTSVRFSDVPMGNKRYLLFSRKTDQTYIEKINAAIIVQQTEKDSQGAQ